MNILKGNYCILWINIAASHQKLGIIFRKFWLEYIFIPFGEFLQKIGADFASEVGHIALHGSIQIAFPYLTSQFQVVDVRSCYYEHCLSPNLLGNSPHQPQCCPICRLWHLSRGHRAITYACISDALQAIHRGWFPKFANANWPF